MTEKSSDNVFLAFNLFYSFIEGFQWFILRKTILFQGFRGGQKFSRGPTFSSVWGGGGQMLISIETYRTCDFLGGTDPPPLDPRIETNISTLVDLFFNVYIFITHMRIVHIELNGL